MVASIRQERLRHRGFIFDDFNEAVREIFKYSALRSGNTVRFVARSRSS